MQNHRIRLWGHITLFYALLSVPITYLLEEAGYDLWASGRTQPVVDLVSWLLPAIGGLAALVVTTVALWGKAWRAAIESAVAFVIEGAAALFAIVALSPIARL